MTESNPPRPSRLVSTPHGIELTIHPQWEVHPAQLKENLDNRCDMLILDVRLPREWDFNRIPGATLVPLNELPPRAPTELAAWKKKPIIVYCHHGGRSMNAAAYLRQHGFENVHSLAGGIDAWSLIVDPSVPRY